MSKIAKCPLCGKDVKKSIWRPEYEGCAGSVVVTVRCCGMEVVGIELWNQYAAAMELASATRALEDAMAPLNSGKLKMGEALPAIRLAMTDQKACEQRVLEVFK